VKLLSFPHELGSRFIGRLRAAHARDPRRLRAAFAAILAVLFILMSIKYAVKIQKPDIKGEQSRSAFLRWREMVNGLFHGANIYVGTNEYPNPPIMAIILRPFTALPPVVGALAWFYTKVLLALIAAAWVFRLVGFQDPSVRTTQPGGDDPPGPPLRLDLARAAALVLCLPSLLGDLSHNNVNILILFLVIAALEAFRRRLDGLAGLTLALAVACKVTPLLFVAYFAWKRCWRVLGAAMAGLVLWVAVVPGAAFGWARTEQLTSDWYALMIERPLLKGEITTEHPNQAVVGFIYRLFTHSPSYIVYPNNIPTPAEYHNLADIGRPAAWVVVKAITALFGVAVLVLCRLPVRRPSDSRHGWRFAAECGLICLGMLLFSERTWKHHAVILLLPLAVLAYAVALNELPRRLRFGLAAALSACFILTALPGLLVGRANDLAMVYGTHTIAFSVLAIAVGMLLAYRSGELKGSFGPSGMANLL
jgi:uncharacterized membrane protein YhdT